MKARLLKKVRGKISLQSRNQDYCVFNRSKLIWTGKDLGMAKRAYILEVVAEATTMFQPKCKKRIL